MRKHFPTSWTFLLVCAASWAALEQPGWAQGVQTSGTARGDVERLQAQLVSQQQQINELRALLDAQQKLLERALPGVVTAPAPPSPPERAAVPAPAAHDAAPAAAPLSLQLGGIAFTPTGFFEYSQIWRSKMVPSGLPTNFAGVPFADTVEGHRRQTLSTAGNTRLGV